MTSAGVVTSPAGHPAVHSRTTTSNVDVVAAAVNEAIKDIEYEAAAASAEVIHFLTLVFPCIVFARKLFLFESGKCGNSHMVSGIPFRLFRGPLFHKPVTGQVLFFAVSYVLLEPPQKPRGKDNKYP